MSFEELKARLVDELTEAQAAIRTDFGLKPRAEAPSKGNALAAKDAQSSPPGRRSAPKRD